MRTLALVLLSLTVAIPASAQFKIPKKVKDVTGAEKATTTAAPAAATGGGGTLVLDDDVVERMIKGMRAAEAYRKDAAKANTPYGRYMQAEAAYAEANAKCEAAKESYTSRMLRGDPEQAQKNADRSLAFQDKMLAAQQKGDTAAAQRWIDSSAAMFDPACVVKDPKQPNDFHDQRQAVEQGAAEAESKASELEGRESGQAKDRAIAIIEDQPPPDVSPSEQKAVDKREKELKDLMGLNPKPEKQAQKSAPAAAAPPPPAAPAASPMDSAQMAAAQCKAGNAQKNEKEVKRLGELAAAAGDAGDMAKALVYADSINRIQSAGCNQ